jgi:hypothetical protein
MPDRRSRGTRIRQQERARRPRLAKAGPRLRPRWAGDLDARSSSRKRAPGPERGRGTHRPEAGPPPGAHAAAGHEERREAAGPAAAPAPQQQAAVRHGRGAARSPRSVGWRGCCCGWPATRSLGNWFGSRGTTSQQRSGTGLTSKPPLPTRASTAAGPAPAC